MNSPSLFRDVLDKCRSISRTSTVPGGGENRFNFGSEVFF